MSHSLCDSAKNEQMIHRFHVVIIDQSDDCLKSLPSYPSFKNAKNLPGHLPSE